MVDTVGQAELDVLIATSLWLDKNGWAIDSVSLATGQGLPRIAQQKETVKRTWEAAGLTFDATKVFKPRGPDIVAHFEEMIWKFECKGLGTGTSQTHRTSFDRALACVMSYFDKPGTRLGLALAKDYLWRYWFGDRLPSSLRQATNLWVFLLEGDEVWPFDPTEDLPYPGALD